MTEPQDAVEVVGHFSFECPSCGAHLDEYTERCPGCGMGLAAAYSATYEPAASGPRRVLAYALLAIIGFGLLMGASLAFSGVGIDQLFGVD